MLAGHILIPYNMGTAINNNNNNNNNNDNNNNDNNNNNNNSFIHTERGFTKSYVI